jgi:hypothetical protein
VVVVRIKLRGSTVALRKYASKIREAGSDGVLRRFSDNMAEEALDLIAEGFKTETNPYGIKWRPKVFGDGRQVLVGNTTRLRRGWHRKFVGANGFIVAPSVEYAKYQQEGTGLFGPRHEKIKPKKFGVLGFYAEGYVSMAAASRVRSQGGNKAVRKMKGSTLYFRSVRGAPQRLMFPNTKALPTRWKRSLNEASNEFWTAYFRKK